MSHREEKILLFLHTLMWGRLKHLEFCATLPGLVFHPYSYLLGRNSAGSREDRHEDFIRR